MIYDISNLEKTSHVSLEERPLYWLDKSQGILTDGYRLYDYIPGEGVMERQYAEIPANHIKIHFEIIQATLQYINTNPSCTKDQLKDFLTNNGLSKQSADNWLSLFTDAVAAFILKESFADCKQWVIDQLQAKTLDLVTKMLIGMLAFTDILPHTNIVIYKNNLPYRQVVTMC